MSTEDRHEGCVVYDVRLEAVPPSSAAEPEFRPSMDPIICREASSEHNYTALAAVSGGTTIVSVVAGSRKTVVHDCATGADTPGPRLRRSKKRPIMLPVGDDDDTVLVMDVILRRGRHCFEALRRVPGWRADALPDPPVEYMVDDDAIDEDFLSSMHLGLLCSRLARVDLGAERGHLVFGHGSGSLADGGDMRAAAAGPWALRAGARLGLWR